MQLQSLESLGAKAEYKQADVTNAQTAADLVKTIETEYGGLHGIIHSAGVMKDQYIAKKTTEEFYSVLAPKTDGFVNLDEATEHLALDFSSFSHPFPALPGMRDRRITRRQTHLWTAMRHTATHWLPQCTATVTHCRSIGRFGKTAECKSMKKWRSSPKKNRRNADAH